MSGLPASSAVESLDGESEGIYPAPRRTYEELTESPLRDDGSKKRSRLRHRVTRSRDRRRRRIVSKAQKKFSQYDESLLSTAQFDDVKQLLNRMYRGHDASVGKDDRHIAYKISNFLIKYDLFE
jgi:hypothetical protein